MGRERERKKKDYKISLDSGQISLDSDGISPESLLRFARITVVREVFWEKKKKNLKWSCVTQ
jgi:hypothetical protein